MTDQIVGINEARAYLAEVMRHLNDEEVAEMVRLARELSVFDDFAQRKLQVLRMLLLPDGDLIEVDIPGPLREVR